MFDFDVVTGPTQPPHCPLADESAGPAVPESAAQPVVLAATSSGSRSGSHPVTQEKPRS
ncbi:hypothetical protein JHL17_12790 [Azospirillum sp. YIM B02556]|uniref:Uncharacterized protein n=1 Tax=Azospirillum endophyticum TaxID=2800326 RepID=A0ABS1F4T2_9PROT|nr:hypothetical protein [Azospirillum endophyticum]MBK1838292.1 hypothetical protein [Azospirillum endophyticum]